MKKQVLLLSRISIMLSTILLLNVSCSDDEDPVSPTINTNLYTGADITSYAAITVNSETKKVSLNILKEGSWKLFGGANTDNINFDIPALLGATSGKSDMEISTYQQFCLEWNDGSRAVFAPRQLPMQEQPNFRDLGGYRTKDGRFVKWGKVFRSGKCSELTESDLMYLSGIPLKTIVDFRTEDERASEADKVPASVVDEKHYPINPGNLGGINISEAIAQGDIESSKNYLVLVNEQLVLNQKSEYKKFFEDLMDGNKCPLMFHCTAGKDRAGFASALFLASLGVDKNTIKEDYLLTNEMTGITVEKMKQKYGDNDMAVCMYYISSVQKEYIEKAFSTIDSNYGSVDNYLVNQLNVDLNRMKELYLY